MSTTSRWAWLLGAALLFCCGIEDIEHGGADDEDFPTRVAEGYCAALFACDPSFACTIYPTPYASEQDCVASEVEALSEVRDAAHTAGLTYDPACVEATLALYTEHGCSSQEQLSRRFIDVRTCPPYYGTVPVDENPCFEVVGSALSTCDANLHCSDDTCRPPPSPECSCDAGSGCVRTQLDEYLCMPLLEPGAACQDDAGAPIGACPPDAVCTGMLDGDMYLGPNCYQLLPDGESCTDAFECASGGCDGTCRPSDVWLCRPDIAPSRWR
ncbi:MAG: hypothetical protein IAG13_26085 [Deltaproteobacteria bacterium]|nr:hypothetical protein [Nannocystaceae bacterium]